LQPGGAQGGQSLPSRAGRSRRSCSPSRGLCYKNPPQSGSAKAMIVNLNKYRKKREHTEGERRAAENRIRFGRGKAARAKDLREHEQAEKSLEDKRLD
jgi:Domain of unknown function (DUF4169)